MSARAEQPDAREAWLRLEPMAAGWLEAVVAVEQAVYTHPWARVNFSDSLAAGYHARVLASDAELVGYFIAMQAPDEVHLLNLTVAPAFQRQGCARLLLDTLALWSRARGARTLWLEVRVSNARARQVYAAAGFQMVGRRRAYYPALGGLREDALVLSRGLDSST